MCVNIRNWNTKHQWAAQTEIQLKKLYFKKMFTLLENSENKIRQEKTKIKSKGKHGRIDYVDAQSVDILYHKNISMQTDHTFSKIYFIVIVCMCACLSLIVSLTISLTVSLTVSLSLSSFLYLHLKCYLPSLPGAPHRAPPPFPHPPFLLPFERAASQPEDLPHPCASSLYRIKHLISHWGQTSQTSEQPVYVLCWWLSLWEIPEIHINWHCWSCCRVAISLKAFNPSPHSSKGVPNLHLMFVFGYLHLSPSVPG